MCSSDLVQIALLIYKNKVVGGQIQSSSGSFLHGLALPGQEGQDTPDASPAPSATAPVFGMLV